MKKASIVKDIIDTDADDSIKGIELQRLRAMYRLLKALHESKKSVYCAVECIDDVSEVTFTDEKTKIEAEQDKFYSTAMSINSEAIKNSLRIFLDTWRRVEESEEIKFVFYSTSGITGEKKVGPLKQFDNLPEEGILKGLADGAVESVYLYAVSVLKNYYKEQYKTRKDASYYAQLVDSYTDKDWLKFFKLIEWEFGKKNVVNVTKDLLEIIDLLCKRFDVPNKHTKHIYSSIKNLIDSTNGQKDFLNKMVHVSEIENIFRDFAREAIVTETIVTETIVTETIDPMYTRWDTIETNDFRNMNEKILAVSSDIDEAVLEEYFDEYIDGKHEQEHHACLRTVKAYNFRVLKKCSKYLKKLIKQKRIDDGAIYITEEDIEKAIEDMVEESHAHIMDKSQTYKVAYKDKDMIRKTILILIEECFLAFDDGGHDNG